MKKEEFIPAKSGISKYGLLVRKAYCIGMRRMGKKGYGTSRIPQFDGGKSQSGREYKDNVWDKIAATLCKNEIDPSEYIEYFFSIYRDVESPNRLLSSTAIAKFKEMIMGSEKPTIWEFELSKLMTELTIKSLVFDKPEEALRYVLLDDTNYVSPLVKYCFGHNKGMDFITDKLEEPAFEQYFRRRFFYERYYKEYIPDNFRQRVKDGEPESEFE